MIRRLTTAQAVIRFLKVQHIRRDDEEHVFFAGCFGILGVLDETPKMYQL